MALLDSSPKGEIFGKRARRKKIESDAFLLSFYFLFFFGIHESSLLSSGNKIPPHPGRPRPS